MISGLWITVFAIWSQLKWDGWSRRVQGGDQADVVGYGWWNGIHACSDGFGGR